LPWRKSNKRIITRATDSKETGGRERRLRTGEGEHEGEERRREGPLTNKGPCVLFLNPLRLIFVVKRWEEGDPRVQERGRGSARKERGGSKE
jgi:hypothetical protein